MRGSLALKLSPHLFAAAAALAASRAPLNSVARRRRGSAQKWSSIDASPLRIVLDLSGGASGSAPMADKTTSSSSYLGVIWSFKSMWLSTIDAGLLGRNPTAIGRFADEEAAAEMRDRVIIHYCGEKPFR